MEKETAMILARGTVVLVDLDPTRGHEEAGASPALIISAPEVAADRRYPLVCVVPITATAGEGALYPRLEPGRSGLRKSSWALVDQIRSVDKRRIEKIYGPISEAELAAVEGGLVLFLGLPRTEREATSQEEA